jgi:hypothetical protein
MKMMENLMNNMQNEKVIKKLHVCRLQIWQNTRKVGTNNDHTSVQNVIISNIIYLSNSATIMGMGMGKNIYIVISNSNFTEEYV